MSSQVRLRLLPRARCLFDEPIKLKVEGLRSRQVVTMRARLTDDKGVVFSSSATYRANGSGEVDLNRDPSLGGSYFGVEPMGLLWSMRAEKSHKKFQKATSLKPQLVNFSVYEEEDRMLAEETNERLLMGDGVSRVPVKEGNISGVLFTPPGEGLFPAVLDILTFRSETRASLLASKGFVVLAIGLVQGKFESFEHYPRFHLDHFKEAIDFLKQQPKVGSKGVGIIGRSKAADLALSLATFVPGVNATVSINGCSANVGVPLYYKKQHILSPLVYDLSKLIPTESGASIGKYIFEDPLAEKNKGSLIPIERAKTHFLFVAGEDDLNYDSKTYMDQMVERLKRHGKENFECVSYRGAGHLLEPPYEPFCPSCAHGISHYIASWGGQPEAHAAAEVHLWKKIQEFFRTHLSSDAAQTKAKIITSG
ncbi:acyl-coenzyme A thioesterase 1 [Oreochromis niloticus]|uniref:Acyl-coenzyme A thioesterase 1 n=1 Tax=Oreochromis niloticus TaxID=8128 RepID=I3KCY0_ORENI|nr:acyl-coenzyme A thioesterase 1 [Oreochromis niloticus]